MKLLLVEWNVYAQQDLEDVLKRMGISYKVFFFPFRSSIEEEDQYFIRHFKKVLEAGDYDAVFSFDFIANVSQGCYESHIPYISWEYDGGIRYEILKDKINFPTNHIFTFDRQDFLRGKAMGFGTLYHMPLAANLERLDRLKVTLKEEQQYGADLSFVGTLYPSLYQNLASRLSREEVGILDSVIETQSKIYGTYYIDQLIDDSICEFAQLKSEGEILYNKETYREGLQNVLCKELARRERLSLLWLASRICGVALYSPVPDESLDKVSFRGGIESYETVYKVYKSSKINLNITFRRIESGIPLRAMDIMGAGGFLLSNYQPELVEYFYPGKECVVYESYEDAIEKIQYYLKHEDERLEIAENGHRAMKNFTYEKQLEKIFNIVFGRETKGNEVAM